MQYIYPPRTKKQNSRKPLNASRRQRLSPTDLSPTRVALNQMDVYSLGPWRESVNSLSYTRLGQAIHDYKYEKLMRLERNLLLELLTKNLVSAVNRTWPKNHFKVCLSVPPSRGAGQDLAGDIASAMSQSIDSLTYCPEIIQKTREIIPVKRIPHIRRAEHVVGAFSIDSSLLSVSSNLLVIDDIVDSGATLGEIRKGLNNLYETSGLNVEPVFVALAHLGRPLR